MACPCQLSVLNERNVEKTGGSGLISTRKVKNGVFDRALLGFACFYVVLASPGLWVASGAATLTVNLRGLRIISYVPGGLGQPL